MNTLPITAASAAQTVPHTLSIECKTKDLNRYTSTFSRRYEVCEGVYHRLLI